MCPPIEKLLWKRTEGFRMTLLEQSLQMDLVNHPKWMIYTDRTDDSWSILWVHWCPVFSDVWNLKRHSWFWFLCSEQESLTALQCRAALVMLPRLMPTRVNNWVDLPWLSSTFAASAGKSWYIRSSLRPLWAVKCDRWSRRSFHQSLVQGFFSIMGFGSWCSKRPCKSKVLWRKQHWHTPSAQEICMLHGTAWSFIQEQASRDDAFALDGVTCIKGAVPAQPPESLQRLTFGDAFNQDLKGVTFPNGLQSLTFGHAFNQTLKGVTFPSGLQSLTLGDSFNHSLEGVTLPSNVKSLHLAIGSTRTWRAWPFQVVWKAWLLAVTSTKAWREWLFQAVCAASHLVMTSTWTWKAWRCQAVLKISRLVGSVKPSRFKWKSLENLTFGFRFNQNLEGVTFPATLQSLAVGDRFNQNLQRVTFPSTLHCLTFGCDFSQNLDGVTLPSHLQSLTLGSGYRENLHIKNIPSSLQSLTVQNDRNKTPQGIDLPKQFAQLLDWSSIQQDCDSPRKSG